MRWRSDTANAGAMAERAAEKHLIAHGLATLTRNYRCRFGEIDLVMYDRQQLVFVEVRHRQSDAYGSPVETITRDKQVKIAKTAEHFIMHKKRLKNPSFRFDVVGILGALSQPRIQWIQNAFGADW